ncbi:hypothetical protein OH540_35615 [Streptomyces sp. BPPL-273]|uniref:hypothetical protein n=1 Tax=Streptomyces sp. BPPL-273 TaxID=2987533 RepID=UPI0024AF55A2|nr:hypothetical protein [Streptomyces sp. BPPL-273]WHM35084.1 hypothetical protein OH540_35615 [Streptomyces sp. BPPL-273]
MANSPNCGHRYIRTSSSRPGEGFLLTATSTWTITWEVSAGAAAGDAGEWTEIRASTVGVRVGKVQVLN